MSHITRCRIPLQCSTLNISHHHWLWNAMNKMSLSMNIVLITLCWQSIIFCFYSIVHNYVSCTDEAHQPISHYRQWDWEGWDQDVHWQIPQYWIHIAIHINAMIWCCKDMDLMLCAQRRCYPTSAHIIIHSSITCVEKNRDVKKY